MCDILLQEDLPFFIVSRTWSRISTTATDNGKLEYFCVQLPIRVYIHANTCAASTAMRMPCSISQVL